MPRTLRLVLAAGACLLGGALVNGARAETISISCGAVGLELKLCQDGVKIWSERTGHQVNVISTPNSSTERLALYQQILAAGSADIDVFQIDIIWTGTLATHMVDLTSHFPPEELKKHFPAIVENNTVDGKLVGMPWFTDAGFLYFRKDLLDAAGKQPPKTWEELTATAKELQDKARAEGNDRMWGYVYQGKAYEGLTCNGLEWIDSFGGGTIIDEDGTISVNNEKAAAGLAWARSTVGAIAPEGVLNYSEEEARGVFQSGNSVFMRNWSYAWPLAQADDSPIKGKIGVTTLPAGGEGGKSSAALGGWQLAVSNYSGKAEVAIELVKYLTSEEEQKRRAIEGAYNPTIEALYQDQDVLAAVPFYADLYPTFTSAVARPSRVTGQRYNQVSSEFFNATHQILSGEAEPAAALADVERKLDRLSRGGRW